MVTITLRKAISATAVLQRIAQAKMPASTSFKVYKMLKALNAETDSYEATRLQVIEKHSDGTNEQQEYTFPNDEARNKCIDELEELLNTEISFDTYDVDLSTLDIDISPVEIEIIDFLFEAA